jgi:hypothetical protein
MYSGYFEPWQLACFTRSPSACALTPSSILRLFANHTLLINLDNQPPTQTSETRRAHKQAHAHISHETNGAGWKFPCLMETRYTLLRLTSLIPIRRYCATAKHKPRCLQTATEALTR